MKIIHVPIERIPSRYTADWIQQFESEFETHKVEFVTIEGDRKEIPIGTGSVLDAYGSNQYKLQQLDKIITMLSKGEIQQDDIIFFADLWFPGIESLFYIRNISGIDFKVAGIYHAGTWDPFDFTSRTGMRDWGQHIELGWLHAVDIIFVATQWHKDLIVMNSGDFDENKIFVTGIPFYSESLAKQYPIQEKENIVVFPHRCDPEKQPEKFDRLKKKYPQWQFIKTLEATSNREEYFNLLARSKVMISFAQQETFGYSTVEAMALGNHVIVPNSLSYRETVPDEMRYTNEKQIVDMLESFMESNTLPEYPELLKWSNSISKMLRVLDVKMKECANNRKALEESERQAQLQKEEERRLKKERLEAEKQAKQAAKVELTHIDIDQELSAEVLHDFANNFQKGQVITLKRTSETEVVVDNVAVLLLEHVIGNVKLIKGEEN